MLKMKVCPWDKAMDGEGRPAYNRKIFLLSLICNALLFLAAIVHNPPS